MFVEPRLMMADQATGIFNELKERFRPSCPLPSNKQRGEKAGPALFTGIINMLHMGYVDEVLFGREVVERIPDLEASWAATYRERDP